jgi:hypothetical protein
MSELEWRRNRNVDRARLHEARLQAHYAAQWLARAARGYIAAQLDDGHTNLGWDRALGGFTTHPLPDGTRLGLSVADLRLVLIGGAGPRATLSLDGHVDADVRAWLGAQLQAKNLDAAALDQPSPYPMPAHPLAGGAAYGPPADASEELAAWYGNADLVLGRVQKRLAERGLRAPPVGCWPHHFDLDTLMIFPSKDIYDTRMMGVGFSPGDEYYDEPYFYVSLYPAPDVAALPAFSMIGHWHEHEFAAAIATASRIAAANDQEAAAEAFLDAATGIAIKTLG